MFQFMPTGQGDCHPFEGKTMSRERLLREVMALDFALIDLGLYLDTHPCDQRALNLFNNYAQSAMALRREYERLYGPLTQNSAATGFRWTWIDEPWPWEGN